MRTHNFKQPRRRIASQTRLNAPREFYSHHTIMYKINSHVHNAEDIQIARQIFSARSAP